MVFLSHWHIGDDALAGLKNYKYSGTDLSLTSKYIMQPYWRFMVRFVPLKMAPNAITLMGLAVLVMSYFLVSYYSPECRSDVPGWAWGLTALAAFTYQTLDALDGKQARRTGTSSPLGELFDHGCDAVGTHLLSLNTMSALTLSEEHSHFGVWYVMLLSGGFYFCAWEQFHTGTLTLGYINGPVEGILTLCAIYLCTAIKGNAFWHDNYILEYTYAELLLCMVSTAGVFTLGGNIVNVYLHNHEGGTTNHPIGTVFPLLVMTASVLALLSEHRAYAIGPGYRTLCCTYGMACACACAKFVTSRVCVSLHKIQPWLCLPTLGFPLAAVIYVIVPRFLEPTQAADLVATLPMFMNVHLAILCLLYLHTALSVIERICKACDINALTMTKKQIAKLDASKGE